jgi:hypothetical protein
VRWTRGNRAATVFCIPILIIFDLYLCAWIFYGRLINPQFDENYRSLVPIFVAGVAVVAILSTFMFFSPMLSVQRLMKKEAAYFEAKLRRLADRVSDCEELLLSKQAELEPKQLEDERAKIQAMRSVYSEQRRIPK